MAEEGRTEVSDATRQEERREAEAAHDADRPANAEEEADVEGRRVDPDVARHEREMTRLGAEVEGEGHIP